jgi:hypothetical protein
MNSLVRTQTVVNEPVSLAAMKNWLKLPPTVTNDDGDISDLISEARIQCELMTNCALVRSTFVQYLDHFPGHHHESYVSGGGNMGYGGYGYPGGYSNTGYNRHHRHYNEIKVKRPPLVSVQSIWFIGTDGRPYTLNPGQDFVVDIASQPGRITPIPYTAWPLTLDVPAAVAIKFTAGYAPNSDGAAAGQTAIAEPETQTSASNPTWQPSKTFAQYAYQVDLNGNIWIQTNSIGITGSTRPAFEASAIGATLIDNTVSWLNVGPIRGFWTPGTQYAGQQAWVVLDFNSNLQLLSVGSLISEPIPPYSLQVVGTSPLPWSQTLGGLTADNGVSGAWRCLGLYTALGDTGLTVQNAPEQQAAVLVDYTLPKTVSRAIKALVWHWYYNREPVTSGSVAKVPLHIEDMLGGVTIHDYAPTP